MKCIYRKYYNEYINDTATGHNRYDLSWHYGELPENKVFVTNNFDDLYNGKVPTINIGSSKTLIRRKRILYSYSNSCWFKKISENTFKSYKLESIYEKIIFTYTFEDLMKFLSAEDFINYCKDNGLNACPIVEG